MFQRFFLHFSLIFLFAFAQLGAATHEYSHVKAPTQQSQPEKNTTAEHCAQCIAYAQGANGLQSNTFNLEFNSASFEFAAIAATKSTSALNLPYSARAPPLASII